MRSGQEAAGGKLKPRQKEEEEEEDGREGNLGRKTRKRVEDGNSMRRRKLEAKEEKKEGRRKFEARKRKRGGQIGDSYPSQWLMGLAKLMVRLPHVPLHHLHHLQGPFLLVLSSSSSLYLIFSTFHCAPLASLLYVLSFLHLTLLPIIVFCCVLTPWMHLLHWTLGHRYLCCSSFLSCHIFSSFPISHVHASIFYLFLPLSLLPPSCPGL